MMKHKLQLNTYFDETQIEIRKTNYYDRKLIWMKHKMVQNTNQMKYKLLCNTNCDKEQIVMKYNLR